MCKFNSHLFVFLAVGSFCVVAIGARPAFDRSLIDYLFTDDDYDLKYDQRQKGGENFRVKLDGFFIGLPAETNDLMLVTDELINVLGEEVLLGRHGNEQNQPDDSKASQLQIVSPDVIQKQVESHLNQNSGVEEPDQQALSQKSSAEGRGGSGLRTKVYIVNLLDYIRRNRRT